VSCQKTKSIERGSSSSTVAESGPGVTDRLASLLPAGGVDKALEGLEPDEICGCRVQLGHTFRSRNRNARSQW
jgi:hypothetical protein